MAAAVVAVGMVVVVAENSAAVSVALLQRPVQEVPIEIDQLLG